jgi:hypothetical protein
LAGQLAFTGIPDLICMAMDTYEANGPMPVRTLADVRAVDDWARDLAARAAGGVQFKVQTRGLQ